jgi:phosphoribosylamine-glycine ligase
VTATGDSLRSALSSAYAAVSTIRFEGMHYRKDVGLAVSRLQAAGD